MNKEVIKMKFKGFEQADFDLFQIEGLEDRMEALKSQLRPKFFTFGEELSEKLSEITGEMTYHHVAKHARRKTNPPNDSWVAFAGEGGKRGYKMLPHFQIAVWNTHVLIQWGIIYEATNKQVFAENLLTNLEEVKKNIPNHFQWFKDHMKPTGVEMKDMTDDDFKEFARRLKEAKNGEVMVGLVISRNDALKMKPEQFYDLVIDSWSKLSYLHILAK